MSFIGNAVRQKVGPVLACASAQPVSEFWARPQVPSRNVAVAQRVVHRRRERAHERVVLPVSFQPGIVPGMVTSCCDQPE